MTGAITLGWLDLALASIFLLIAAGVSLYASLGLEKGLLWAGVRGLAQLSLLGLALRWIFAISSPLIVALFILAMLLMATHMMLKRVKKRPEKLYLPGLFALAIPGITITFAVTAGVIGIEPFYDPRYLLPIAGMVIGNSFSAMSVVLDRLFSDLSLNAPRINAMLALGATPREAVWDHAKEALRAGMIPTLNSLSAAGIVFIPGMMTGQILSGTDPATAARYQIVILFMICAATAMGSILAVAIGYRRSFDSGERFTLNS